MSLLLILTLVAVSLPGGAQPFPADIQRLLDQRKITVAVLAVDYPPFLITGADGRLQGFDARLARAIAQELGVEVEFMRTAATFDDVVRQVAARQADLGLSLLTITPYRAQLVYFSTPYLTMHPTLLVNRRLWLLAHKNFPGQDIRNTSATIGVVSGSSLVRTARQIFPRATLKEYASLAEEVAAARKGESFAVLADDLVVQGFLKDNPGVAVDLYTHVIKDLLDYIGIAVRPDSPHLLAWLNAYLLANGLNLTSGQFWEKLSTDSPPAK